MTKTAKKVIDNLARDLATNARADDPPQGRVYLKDQALKELEAIIEKAYETLPGLDKLAVGNEMNDGYDRGVEAFRRAVLTALYGKESSDGYY